MQDEEELLDLVNDKDEVIQTIKRVQYYASNPRPDGYLRSTEMLIRNSKGQLWIPRRTANKRVAPSSLDYSCGGHVSAGEDYLTSLIREAEEELSLKLTPNSVIFLRKFNPKENQPWFRKVYLYEQDEVPEYNKADFQEYYWLMPQELLKKLKAGDKAKISLLETIEQIIDRLTI